MRDDAPAARRRDLLRKMRSAAREEAGEGPVPTWAALLKARPDLVPEDFPEHALKRTRRAFTLWRSRENMPG